MVYGIICLFKIYNLPPKFDTNSKRVDLNNIIESLLVGSFYLRTPVYVFPTDPNRPYILSPTLYKFHVHWSLLINKGRSAWQLLCISSSFLCFLLLLFFQCWIWLSMHPLFHEFLNFWIHISFPQILHSIDHAYNRVNLLLFTTRWPF